MTGQPMSDPSTQFGRQTTPARRRASRRPTTSRLFLRWFGVLCLPATIAIGSSLVSAMRAVGSGSSFERSVEWLRGHHYGDTVSWIEHAYYSRSQPPRGGTLANLPRAV